MEASSIIEIKQYIPHDFFVKYHKCIHFTFYLVLFFMLYWFILCPILFSQLLYFRPINLSDYFWPITLAVFTLLLILITCVYKRVNKRKEEIYHKPTCVTLERKLSYGKRDYITIRLKDDDESKNNISNENLNGILLEELKPAKVDDVLEEGKVEGAFPRCSVRRKPNSLNLNNVDRERPLSQNLDTPLQPRELFFYDFIESANNKAKRETEEFIQREREFCNNNDVKDGIRLSVINYPNEESTTSPAEYFIANVPEDKHCTSQVFLFVNEDQNGAVLDSKNIIVDLN